MSSASAARRADSARQAIIMITIQTNQMLMMMLLLMLMTRSKKGIENDNIADIGADVSFVTCFYFFPNSFKGRGNSLAAHN